MLNLTLKGYGLGATKRRPTVLACFLILLAAPAVLSPSHPIAAYGFLLDIYGAPLKGEAFASATSDLTQFMTSAAQVERYRKDLLADVMDTRSGKFFVVSRDENGELHQDEIRTWNDFVPAGLSSSLDAWLDRKEFPFLGDEVEVWARGRHIEAVGHYHAYGGSPSDGDAWAQRLTGLPEIVIVNGLIPSVYVNRELVEYGHDIRVSPSVFKSMRSLERCIEMDVRGDFIFPDEPTPNLKSFLGYLKEYRGVDIDSIYDISKEIENLYREMETDYTDALPKGFHSCMYMKTDPDIYNFLSHVGDLRCWSVMYKTGMRFN